jgi:transposase
MISKAETESDEAEKWVRDIRRATRGQYSAEEKIRMVIAGLRGEDSIAQLCRNEGINQNLYYRRSKDFLEAVKKRPAGDTAREATSDEGKEIQAQARQLKELVAELTIENLSSAKLFGREVSAPEQKYITRPEEKCISRSQPWGTA